MDVFQLMDNWCWEKNPFFFMLDFEMKKPLLFPLQELREREDIVVYFPQFYNGKKGGLPIQRVGLSFVPIDFDEYLEAYHWVQKNIHYGNSYLTNLTFSTSVYFSGNLESVFYSANAPYKLLYKDEFCCFSPEKFIEIKENVISTFPMKGTIDARIEGAAEVLLKDEKEKAEHATVVDLLRNDLSRVAETVHVKRYRYIEEIPTPNGNILQSSSEISGCLKGSFKGNYGSVLKNILPAGSISGAPKESTLKIISQVEKEERGFYTGVMGIFDGENLYSAVMIRFLEKKNNRYFYRSGGGITSMSDAQEEYQELNDKIYVPIF